MSVVLYTILVKVYLSEVSLRYFYRMCLYLGVNLIMLLVEYIRSHLILLLFWSSKTYWSFCSFGHNSWGYSRQRVPIGLTSFEIGHIT